VGKENKNVVHIKRPKNRTFSHMEGAKMDIKNITCKVDEMDINLLIQFNDGKMPTEKIFE